MVDCLKLWWADVLDVSSNTSLAFADKASEYSDSTDLKCTVNEESRGMRSGRSIAYHGSHDDMVICACKIQDCSADVYSQHDDHQSNGYKGPIDG
jgi:hypothetical protein